LNTQETEKFLLDLYDSVVADLKNNDTEVLAETLIVLDKIKKEVSELLDQTREVLVRLMGELPEIQHNGFVLEKKNGSPRKSWDHKALAEIVSNRIVDMSVDMDTGEITKTPQEMLMEIVEYTGISYWRVKELSKIGINADRYCEVGEPKANIIIRSN
jgi:acetolactate synthase small subunit